MTWETEESSDAQSHSQMTTDTYGYGDAANDQNIIWSDDPERAYFKSVIRGRGEDNSSMLGDSTTNDYEGGQVAEMQDGAPGNAPYGDPGARMTSQMQDTSFTSNSFLANPMVDSSGLSYYDTDAEDDTIGRIEADKADHGWFAMRRNKVKNPSKRQQKQQLQQLQLQLPQQAPEPSPSASSSKRRLKAYNFKSPISALSPQDKAGEGMGPNQPYAVPNPNIVPTSPGNRPVSSAVPQAPADGREIMADLEGYGADGKIIPGYIFVTAGHSSAVQTNQSPKGSKNPSKTTSTPTGKRGIISLGRQSSMPKARNAKQQPPLPAGNDGPAQKFTKQELTVDTDDLAERRSRRKFCLCKIGIAILMIALAVGIAMLSLVFVSKRNLPGGSGGGGGGGSPTMSPHYFLTTVPNAPTSIPTSPPRPGATAAPTGIPAAATSSPTMAITAKPTMATTQSPTDSPTATSPTMVPSLSPIDTVKNFLVAQFPTSASALQNTTSPQFLALQWIAQEFVSSGNRRLLRDRQLQQASNATTTTMDWRLVQRWVLAVLYFSTGGNDTAAGNFTTTWTSATGWLQLANECQWDFVLCDSSGRVSELTIQSNALAGTIPPEVGLFANGLVKLSLNSNELEGTLPTSLGLLTALTRLFLQGNQLTGSLPTEMGEMVAMQFLSLSRNLFAGPIPSQLGNVVGLITLDLDRTDLSGTIPTQLGRMTGLELISLGSTSISGTIPTQFGDLPLLSSVKVARTNLVGSMPQGICSSSSGAQDIQADCLEVNCTCCTTCCVDGGGCTGPTPSPSGLLTQSPTANSTSAPTLRTTPNPTTKAPSPSPTAKPTRSSTRKPTAQPVTASPTKRPSPPPTKRPSSPPTLNPTKAPVTTPTKVPTAAPTTQPTMAQPLSPAPSACVFSISTGRDCYTNGENVVVDFVDCNALFDDWIGVYASGPNLIDLGTPIAWVWTSGDQFAQFPVSSGNITFSQARGNGVFQVVLARNHKSPPYTALAVSNKFQLAATCP